jgi:hypothetical protein
MIVLLQIRNVLVLQHYPQEKVVYIIKGNLDLSAGQTEQTPQSNYTD